MSVIQRREENNKKIRHATLNECHCAVYGCWMNNNMNMTHKSLCIL